MPHHNHRVNSQLLLLLLLQLSGFLRAFSDSRMGVGDVFTFYIFSIPSIIFFCLDKKRSSEVFASVY